MAIHYELVRPASGWNDRGPTSDRVLSKHKSLEAANKEFDRTIGPLRIVRVCDGVRTIVTSSMC
jgi:hypothetical protein